jgi:argininosuccinate lyase
MIDRDRTRFAAAADASAESPLGAGRLPARRSGSIRRRPDAELDRRVSDRDFALDYLYAAAMLAQHLSRIGEEIVLWSTAEFGFVRLPENASTGSSMMPQKLNPDVAELVRGKGGTAIGRLAGLLATVKGLPLAYDRTCRRTSRPCSRPPRRPRLAPGMTVLVSGLAANRERLAEAVADPLLLATDVAEDLVRGGIPFREAHEQVAASVRDGTFSRDDRRGKRCRPALSRPGRRARRDRRARKRFGQGAEPAAGV